MHISRVEIILRYAGEGRMKQGQVGTLAGAVVGAAGGNYESGSSSAQSSEDQAYAMNDPFMYYRNTLTVWARRLGLQPGEAVPVLTSRIVNSMGAVLP